MNKTNLDAVWLSLVLDRDDRKTLLDQLTDQLRHLIHAGRLGSGDRLPPSRTLAAELSVSRITVTNAYEQLAGEGYLDGRQGAGVFVAAELEGVTLIGNLPRTSPPLSPPSSPTSSPAPPAPMMTFEPRGPDITAFPFAEWSKLHDAVWHHPNPALFTKPDPLGYGPLRVEIAHHLRDWRNLEVAPDQVIITSGLAESLDLLASAVLPPGAAIAVEDPGYALVRYVLQKNRLGIIPVPVDRHGFAIDLLTQPASGMLITPSRQYPMGMTMPLARRLAILEWANTNDGYIIEDDFDGEFNYNGAPLPALKSLDRRDRVIYLGSFSKVMFSGLRIGYLVVPHSMVTPIETMINHKGIQVSFMSQPVLAKFIETGKFGIHLRRMRRLYNTRMKALIDGVAKICPDLLHIDKPTGGMHAIAHIIREPATGAKDWQGLSNHQHPSDPEIVRRAKAAGISLTALSDYSVTGARHSGLVMGFAAYDEAQILAAVKTLAAAIDPGRA